MTRLELYQKGYTDREISDTLNEPIQTISSWRWRKGYPVNKEVELVNVAKAPKHERKLVAGFLKELLLIQDKAEYVLGRNLNKQEVINLVAEAFR